MAIPVYASCSDVVVIVSGDGDFVELVHALKAMGVTVEVMSFPQNTSEELKRAADRYLPIDEDFIRQAHKLENEEVMTPDALETL